MLDICSGVAKNLDLLFNVNKSCIMRIGKRCNVKCCNLYLDGKIIAAVDEIKYLGISIQKCLNFSRSFCNAKIKFYRCFNSIYSKASFASEEVLINLFKFHCLPIILYACEAVGPSNSDMKTLNKLISTAFNKNFHTFDVDVISEAKSYFGLLDIADILRNRQIVFVSRFLSKNFKFSEVIRDINRCSVFGL